MPVTGNHRQADYFCALAPDVLNCLPQQLPPIMATKKTAKKAAPAAPPDAATPKVKKTAAAKPAAAKPAAAAKTPPAQAASVASAAETAPHAAKVPAPKAAKPSPDVIARAAYLNYRRRVDEGLPGDSHDDWLAAEREFQRAGEP